MASSIIRGKYVVTKAQDSQSSEIIEDGAVFQRNGEIMEVGKFEEVRKKHRADKVIGSEKQVVIPGLVNAHHHVGLTPFQLGNLDLALEPWIAVRMANRDVDPYLDTLYCAIQMVEFGITTVMHNHATHRKSPGMTFQEGGAAVIKAYQDAGMRVAFSFSHRDQNQIVYQEDQAFLKTLPKDLASKLEQRLKVSHLPTTEYLAVVDDVYRQFQEDPRVRVFVSPGNVQWCSDSMLEGMKEYASRRRTGLHIHLQESVYQKMYGLRTWGKTPLAHLNDVGVLGPEVSCAHGVWVTESDIDTMAATGTMVSHNASSNLRLKSGVAPVNRMNAKGVVVAIGIDEAGLNDDKDMMQEMRLVSKIHREPGVSAAWPSSHQVLHMATVNGAKATFFAPEVGTLEKGKRADMVLVNLEHIMEPYLDPDTNIVDAILYRARGVDVDTSIVDGEVIMEGRKMTRVKKEDVWRELKEQMGRPLAPHEEERREVSKRLLPYVQKFYEGWELGRGRPHYVYNEAG
jgi:cytosine/adenosine deaminase-related metal-dependent hydrolase